MLLAINLTFQQFLLAPRINAEPGNQRTVLAEYERERGPIQGGAPNPVARSIATPKRTFKFLRTYPDGVCRCWPPVSPRCTGSTGLEQRSRTTCPVHGLVAIDIQRLVAGARAAPSRTTLVASARRPQRRSGLRRLVTAIDPKTSAISPRPVTPFDPNRLAHDAAQGLHEQLDADPWTSLLLNRPLVQTIPTVPAFKLVTAAAALPTATGRIRCCHGPASTLPRRRSRSANWSGAPVPRQPHDTGQRPLRSLCNSAFAYLGNDLGAERLRTQARKFGFESSFDVPMTAATSRYPRTPTTQTAMSAIGCSSTSRPPACRWQCHPQPS